MWGKPTDQAIVDETLGEDIPDVLRYLESQVPRDGFLFGTPSIADVAVAVFFRNAAFARFRVDAERWPLTAAFVDRVLGLPSFQKLAPIEERTMRTPIRQVRTVLAEMGVPLSRETYGTDAPRRGVMPI